MSTIFEQPSLWQRVRPVLFSFDGPLSTAVLLLAAYIGLCDSVMMFALHALTGR